MYPSQTILVKGKIDNRVLDDDLSTLSGSSTGASFSRQHLPLRDRPNHSNGSNHRNRKNKLHSYLSNSIRRQSNKTIIAANKRQPSTTKTGNCFNEHKGALSSSAAAGAPFDEVPTAIVTKMSPNKGEGDNDSDSDSSDTSPVFAVLTDGNLEPIMQTFRTPVSDIAHNSTCDRRRPRGQNQFEKSEKSAFVPTTPSTATSRSSGSSDVSNSTDGSYSIAIYDSPARSTRSDGSVRQTRLERLKRTQHGRTVDSNSVKETTVLPGQPQDQQQKTEKDDHVNLQKKISDRMDTTDTNSKSNGTQELSKSQAFDNDTKFTTSKNDFERNVTRLQQKLKDAKLALNYQRKILSEMSKQEELDDLTENTHDHYNEHIVLLSQNSTGNSAKELNDIQELGNTSQPTSPKSLLSSDTKTTACTSTTTSPPTGNTGHSYISINRARMRKRFLRNRKNSNKQDPPPSKSPVAGRVKSIGIDNEPPISLPPNLKRTPNFSMLSSAGSKEIKQKEIMHALRDESQSNESDQYEDFYTKSVQLHPDNNNIRDSAKVPIDENETVSPMPSSVHEPGHHTLNLFISISGNSRPALDKFLKNIMRDLDRHEQEDGSILSTKCVLSSNLNQSNYNNDTEAKSEKKLYEIEDSALSNDSLLSTPTPSFIDDFRKAVDSLQASNNANQNL